MARKKEKTALVLSGGGSRGAYEAGVWQALTEMGVEIDVVTGASVGAINGAMVCQGSLELTVKLWKEIQTHMVFDVPQDSQPFDYAKEIIVNGGAGMNGLKELLTEYVDEKKIRRSPVEYGLVVVERSSFKPRYLFKNDIPEGKLVDYILASSSVFPVIHSYEIDGVEYVDGGYADVLPIGMAALKKPSRIIAVKLNAIGVNRSSGILKNRNVKLIQSPWDLGNTFVFDVANSRRIMRLGYLDALKAFKVLDGKYFAVAKGDYTRAELSQAEACGRIFALEPTLIYTKASFRSAAAKAVASSQSEFEEAMKTFKDLKAKHVRLAPVIRDLKSLASARAFCLIVAKNIKEKGADSIYLKPAALSLIPDVVYGARYLANYGLV